MIFVPRDASSEQVLDIVHGWIDLLAAEDYQAAFEAIAFPAPDERWTPDFIKNDIKNYRSPEHYPGVEDFRVTDWRTAQGGNSEAEQKVLWFHPTSDFVLAGYVDFDLPLNGQWSDLTAEFDIWENDNLEEGYLLSLNEISSWKQRQREQEED